MKPCATCNEVKPLTEFYKHPTGRDGHFKHCKMCDSKRAKQWAKDNKNKILIRKYGITEQTFNYMLEEQCGRCAICGIHFESSKNTHIDHSHETGKVRALLCNHCNRGIGLLKESVQTLKNAIYYLNKHLPKE